MSNRNETQSLLASLDSHWRALMDNKADLSLSGRDCSIDIRLASDHAERYLRIVDGRLLELKPGPRAMHRYDVSFTANESSWRAFWSAKPGVGFHDIFAMSSFGHMTIGGDTDTLLRHLGFIKKLLALPRGSFTDVEQSQVAGQ